MTSPYPCAFHHTTWVQWKAQSCFSTSDSTCSAAHCLKVDDHVLDCRVVWQVSSQHFLIVPAPFTALHHEHDGNLEPNCINRCCMSNKSSCELKTQMTLCMKRYRLYLDCMVNRLNHITISASLDLSYKQNACIIMSLSFDKVYKGKICCSRC